jgi:hypothetical protein
MMRLVLACVLLAVGWGAQLDDSVSLLQTHAAASTDTVEKMDDVSAADDDIDVIEDDDDDDEEDEHESCCTLCDVRVWSGGLRIPAQTE